MSGRPRFLCQISSVVFLMLLVSGCGGSGSFSTTPPAGPSIIALAPFVNGFSGPTDFQSPDDGSGRIFIVQQTGTIRVISGGSLLTSSFLDITSKVNFDGAEQGLLGLAFHPSYSQNRRFYLNYDRLSSGQIQTVIAEYQASTDPNVADPASERILLTVDQPFPNHKGGQLAFGPDGFLYIGLGDGGSGGDPLGNGQNRQTLLGKILRIDVDHADTGIQYAIPVDNPFVGGSNRGEIWADGFRNPWRFSFERGTGRLFVADVGQDKFEEYDHSEGEVIIGGYVYHGTAIPAVVGAYLFADFSNGKIWELTENSGTWTRTLLLTTGRNISSFGQDAAGELYVVDYSSGSVLKIVAP